MSHLENEPSSPDKRELAKFWHAATQSVRGLGNDYEVRWIGLDDATTEQILELIRSGDKTGTFSLPWIRERTGKNLPGVGDAIVLVSFDSKPQLVVRITEITEVAFGDISEEHTAVDGSPVRALAVWKPLHIDYWNERLLPLGLAVCDDMPVLIEKFELVYDAAGQVGAPSA